MDEQRVREIRARLAVATPGPWGTYKDATLDGTIVVVHESPMGTRDDGTERIDYGVAGSVHDRPPVNHLAYCRALGERRGDDGRYFIARLTEIPDPEPEVGP